MESESDKNFSRKNVSIIGMGYVGLCLAASLSKLGTKVYCIDIDEDRINQLKKGESPIHEPQLPELIKMGVENGTINATTNIQEALNNSDVTFICVGTPCDDEGFIDLKYIKNSAKDIGLALKNKDSYHVISVKSTVIPGTLDSHVIPIIEEHSGKKIGVDFGACMTPEFLKEGAAIDDFLKPDKIVIGSYDKMSSDWMYNVFFDFWPEKFGKDIFLYCDLRTAEMIKYANNSFLALKISFINEMANLSEIFGVDVKKVAEAIGMDKRISSKFLNAGLGFGGSCFPKDVKALYSAGKTGGYTSKTLIAALDVNELQPYRPLNILNKEIQDLSGKTIAILGLSFKPNTDDIRFAPSIKIIKKLLEQGSNIRAYDPVSNEIFEKFSGIQQTDRIKYFGSSIDAISGSDAVIIVTEWDEFKELKPEDFISNMNKPIIIDGRRIFNPKVYNSKNLKYYALGYSDLRSFKP